MDITLATRLLTLTLQIHHSLIVANPSLRPLLLSIHQFAHQGIQFQKDRVGLNLAGLKWCKKEWETSHSSGFFDVDESLSK